MIGRGLSKKIAEMPDGISYRMGVVTAYSAGPPRTVTATMGGVSITDIPIMDHVAVSTGNSIWIMALKGGRMIGIGSVDGDKFAFPPQPRVLLRKSTHQVISNVNNTSILWDTETYDTGNLHSLVTNTSDIVIPSGMGGVWLSAYTIGVEAVGTGISAVWIETGGGTRYATTEKTNDNNATTLTGSAFIVLGDGESIRMRAYQTSGAGLNYVTSSGLHYFQAIRISD